LQHSGFRPTRSIELILFTSEEPTRFGIGVLGSRMLSGALTAEAARKLQTVQAKHWNTSGKKQICKVISNPFNSVRPFHAFVELHIEQGPLLEHAHVPLGIVESIAAPASYQ